MIYGYVNGLQYDTPVEIWGWDLSMAKLLPPICLVNKQLWVEASTFFIEKNVLDVCTDARDMSGWLHSFPDNEGYAAVRKLKLSSELSYEEYSGSYGVEYEPDNLELVARCPNIRNIKLKYRLRNFGWSSEKREKLEDSELDRIWSDLRLSVLFDCKNLEQVKLRYIITSIEHNDGGSYAEDLAERRRGPTPEAVDVMEGIKNLLERGFTERGMNVSVENTSHNILLDLWEEFG
ncbi:hypothetical protein BU16DRAFT_85987 [Lophium mytilinum]|uniref:Uncharacterized protein n=1 Tax=Lophium mytilinum TaxID=390894 RepID=A0A6A6QJZ4_9PEZI|nr:hypothetical protein BU16DRAFT_85987 [Lophium mytilinum]